MDIRDFSNKLAEATKNMSEEEREALKNMFEGVTKEIMKNEAAGGSASDSPAPITASEVSYDSPQTGIPDGPTPRIVALKETFMKQVPTIDPG